MIGWSKNRREGRALEHGLVAWARSKQCGKPVFRARLIRMLCADGSVDKIDDPSTLADMQWYASQLADGLSEVAQFEVCFAEQTIWKRRQSISIDVRGAFRRKESWIEVKWTRGGLQVALAAALQKCVVFRQVAKDDEKWHLDRHFCGSAVPQPAYIGGLAASPAGWQLCLVDENTGRKELWTGFFQGAPPTLVPSKVMTKMAVKAKTTKARRRSLEKHKRYNKSVKGKARAKVYKNRQAHKNHNKQYQLEYANSTQGREARAAARRRYKEKNGKGKKTMKKKRG